MIRRFESTGKHPDSGYRADDGRHHAKSAWLGCNNHHAPASNDGLVCLMPSIGCRSLTMSW
nr:MAG TPA: hypothetical protein [Caudoviricetes sp.]